jgi:formate dehydrogenase subunit gamma
MMREGAPVASRHTAWSADAGERVLRGLHQHDRLVLPALQALQAEFGYVHPDAVAVVASFTNVSVAETHGVLTFYHELRRPRPGDGGLCSAGVPGERSRSLRAAVEADRPVGGRSADGRSTRRRVFCLGNCASDPQPWSASGFSGASTSTASAVATALEGARDHRLRPGDSARVSRRHRPRSPTARPPEDRRQVVATARAGCWVRDVVEVTAGGRVGTAVTDLDVHRCRRRLFSGGDKRTRCAWVSLTKSKAPGPGYLQRMGVIDPLDWTTGSRTVVRAARMPPPVPSRYKAVASGCGPRWAGFPAASSGAQIAEGRPAGNADGATAEPTPTACFSRATRSRSSRAW